MFDFDKEYRTNIEQEWGPDDWYQPTTCRHAGCGVTFKSVEEEAAHNNEYHYGQGNSGVNNFNRFRGFGPYKSSSLREHIEMKTIKAQRMHIQNCGTPTGLAYLTVVPSLKEQ